MGRIQLRRDVGGPGLPFTIVNACGPDGTHCERSLAITAAQDVVIDLARRYNQLAVLWFDGGAFWILPAVSHLDPLRLPPG